MNKQQLYELLKPLIEIYDSIERDMIIDILDRIDNYNGIKGTLKWYLDKLNELKVFERNNISIVNKNKKEIKKILEDIIEVSSRSSINLEPLESYNNRYNTNISINNIYKSISATNLISEALKSTENICKLINTKAVESANQQYRNILNTAYLETSTGIYTYDQSIKRAVDKMAENGILMANYDSGRKISIEAAVRRDIITRVNQLVGDVELETAKQLGTNLVYVDQHLGARTRTKYMKHEYEAHDEWQGKVYMIEGFSDKYRNLYEATGYKEMLGLKGLNCYHDLRPFFEWEKIPNPIDIEESKKQRKILDKQKEYECNIRALKRKKMVAKKMGCGDDYKQFSSKLIKLNKEYKEFYEKNGLNRNLNREYISKNMKCIKPESLYKDVTKEWLDEATPNSHKVLDRNYFEHEGVKYEVDSKNVVLDCSNKEKDIAEWLENTFGGEIYMLPRINKPSGIQTADYLFRNEYWDLKEISGNGKHTLDSAIKKKKSQSNNFIFDVSLSKITEESINTQLDLIYKSKDRKWLDKIIIKRDNEIVVIYKRK